MAETSPFQPCDVRGVYPAEVNERLLAAIGRVLPSVLPFDGPLVLGGDARLSTPSLLSALATPLASAHQFAAVLQPFPTPGLYYVGQEVAAGATLTVTASHNPPHYNGLKLLVHGEAPRQEDMARLAAAAARGYERGAEGRGGGPEVEATLGGGACDRSDAAEWARRYAEHLLSLAPTSRPLRLVVDAGNGCLCGLAAHALRRAGHAVSEIHGHLDGRFPGRGPDPTANGALDDLAAAVVAARADIGVAFDGDGDRVVFVDACGGVVPADSIAALLGAQAIASDRDTVVLDVRTSRLLTAWLRQRGAEVMLSRPGHAFVRSALRRRHARFGAEVSGHYFFAEMGGDDALYAALRLASLVGEHGPLAHQVAALPAFHVMPEARIPYGGPAEPVLAAVSEMLAPLAVDDFGGGLILDLGDAWVVARPSITEPMLAMRCEATTVGRLGEVVSHLEQVLNGFGLSLGASATVDPIAPGGQNAASRMAGGGAI